MKESGRFGPVGHESGRERPHPDAEVRKGIRERVGAEIIRDYLTASSDDDAETREFKEKLAGKDLEETLMDLMDTDDPAEVAQALEEMGISRSTQKTRSGEPVQQWRLRLPGQENANLPGAFANEQHLKAFVAGFAGARDLEGKLAVIDRIFEYLDMETPAGLRDDESEAAEPVAPPAVEPMPEPLPEPGEAQDEEAVVVTDSGPITQVDRDEVRPVRIDESLKDLDPKWRKAFDRLGLKNLMPFFVALAIYFPGEHGMGRQDRDAESEDTIVAVTEPEEGAPLPGPEIDSIGTEKQEAGSGVEKYSLQEGENVAGVVQGLLGDFSDDEEFRRKVIRQVLKDNDIGDPAYGAEGSHDAYRLPEGFTIDLSSAHDMIDDYGSDK